MKRPIQRKRLTRLLSALLILALGFPTPSVWALRPVNAGMEESPVRAELEFTLTAEAPQRQPIPAEPERPHRITFAVRPGHPTEMTLPTGETVKLYVRSKGANRGRVVIQQPPGYLTFRYRSLQPGAVWTYTLYKMMKIFPRKRTGEDGYERRVDEGVYFFPLAEIEEFVESGRLSREVLEQLYGQKAISLDAQQDFIKGTLSVEDLVKTASRPLAVAAALGKQLSPEQMRTKARYVFWALERHFSKGHGVLESVTVEMHYRDEPSTAGLEENFSGPEWVLQNREEGEQAAIRYLQQVGGPVVLVFGDVDWLGLTNRLYSKPVVNPILAQLFGTLKREAEQRKGMIYRHGGDEFVLLLPLKRTTDAGTSLQAQAEQELAQIRETAAAEMRGRYKIARGPSGQETPVPEAARPYLRAQHLYAGRQVYLFEIPSDQQSRPVDVLKELQTAGFEPEVEFPMTVSLGGQVIPSPERIDLPDYDQLRFRASDWLVEAKKQSTRKNASQVGNGIQASTHRHQGDFLLRAAPRIAGENRDIRLQDYSPEKVHRAIEQDLRAGRPGILLELVPRYRWANGTPTSATDANGDSRFKAINELSYRAGDDMIKLLLKSASEAFSPIASESSTAVARAPPVSSADSIWIWIRFSKEDYPSLDDTEAWRKISRMVDRRVYQARAVASEILRRETTPEFRDYGIQVQMDWAGASAERATEEEFRNLFSRLNQALIVVRDQQRAPSRWEQIGFLLDPPEERALPPTFLIEAQRRVEQRVLQDALTEAAPIFGYSNDSSTRPAAGVEESPKLIAWRWFKPAATAAEALAIYHPFEEKVLVPRLNGGATPEILLGIREAAINLMEHGGGGDLEVFLSSSKNGVPPRLTIRLENRGPGLIDPNEILRESAAVHAGVRQGPYEEPRGYGWKNIVAPAVAMTVEANRVKRRLVRDSSQDLRFEWEGPSEVGLDEGVITVVYEMKSAAGVEESRRRIQFAEEGMEIFVTPGQFASDDSVRLFLDLFKQHPDWLEGDILELGTGAGAISILLARHGRRAVGLDIQPQAVADAEFNKANQPDEVQQRLTFGVSDLYQNLAQITGDSQRRFDAMVFIHPVFIGNFYTSKGEPFKTAAYAGPTGEVVRRAVEGLGQVLKPGKSGFFFAAVENDTNLNVLSSDNLRAMLPDSDWRMDSTGITLDVPERYRQGGEYLDGHIIYEMFRITPPLSAYAGAEEMDPMYVREAVQGLYQFPDLVEQYFGKDGAQPASWETFLAAAGRESSWTWDGLGSFWKAPQKMRQWLAYRSLLKIPVPLRLSVGGELVVHNQRQGVLLLGENGAEPSLLAIFMTGDSMRGYRQHNPWEWITAAQKNEHTWTYLGGNGDLLVLEFPQGLYAGRLPSKTGQRQPLTTRFPLVGAAEVPVHEGSFEGRAFRTEIEGKDQFVPLKGVVRFSRHELLEARAGSLPLDTKLPESLRKLPAQDLSVDLSLLRWRNNWEQDPKREEAIRNLQGAVRVVEDFFVPQFSAGVEEVRSNVPFPKGLEPSAKKAIHDRIRELSRQRGVRLSLVAVVANFRAQGSRFANPLSTPENDLFEDIVNDTVTGRPRPDADRDALLTYVENAYITAGLEEHRLALVMAQAQETVDGFRSMSGVDSRTVVVISREWAKRLPGLQVLAGLEERVVIDREDLSDTLTRAAQLGDTVYFYGDPERGAGLEELAKKAGMSLSFVLRNPKEDSRTALILRQIFEDLGVPSAAISAGLEEFTRSVEDLGQAA